MADAAEVATAIVGAGKAVAAARDALQQSNVATARNEVLKDNLTATMSKAEALIDAAANQSRMLARDALFAVDMEILTSRMQSVKSKLLEYESVPFMRRFLCGDIPDEFLEQHAQWIQRLLDKWQDKLNELMSMTPEEVDAQDFARARQIFARPLLLVDNQPPPADARPTACSRGLGVGSLHELQQVLVDMQVSIVSGLLYQRGTSQGRVLQNIGFSLASHTFKTRRYNRGRDHIVAKLSTLSKASFHAADWNAGITELRALVNCLLPADLVIEVEEEEKFDCSHEAPLVPRVRVSSVPPTSTRDVDVL